MNRRIVFGTLLALLLIAGAVGLGVSAYQAGVAQGLAESGKLVAPAVGAMPYYGGPFFFRPFGFGFGCLGFLFPLLFFFLFFGLLRGLFWGGRWGHRGHWAGRGPGGQGVPPMFEEWHKQAHGESTGQSQEPPAQSS